MVVPGRLAGKCHTTNCGFARTGEQFSGSNDVNQAKLGVSEFFTQAQTLFTQRFPVLSPAHPGR